MRLLLGGKPLRDYVLAVGAAHIDVFADYSSGEHDKLDKVGSVRYAVGGTAYNVAVNLGQAGIPVALLTMARRNSFTSTWILERLESNGVDTRFVDLRDGTGDSGFIAIRRDQALETAVTASVMGTQPLKVSMLKAAVEHARLVAFDCNLPADEISLLLECATHRQKPLAAAAVSDSKVRRLLTTGTSGPRIELVVLNEKELEAAGVASIPSTAAEARAICKQFGAKDVILTRGPAGHLVVRGSGDILSFPAPDVERIVARSGAGDALFAAMLAYWYKTRRLDYADMANRVNVAVAKVLQQPGATSGAVTTDVDFSILARIARRREPMWKRFLSAEVGTLATLVAAVFTVLAFIAMDIPSCTSHPADSHAAIRVGGLAKGPPGSAAAARSGLPVSGGTWRPHRPDAPLRSDLGARKPLR